MKTWRTLLALSLLFSNLLVSCSENSKTHEGSVQVILPWLDEKGSYTFQPITIESLTNLEQGQGRYAEFVYQPNIVNGALQGIRPDVKLARLGGGLYMPIDFLSTEVFSLYAHTERLAHLDESLGVDLSGRPLRKIGVTLPIDGDPSSRNSEFRNNAFYLAGVNSLLFLPYRLNRLSVGINAGVVAHEHFHSHFDYFVREPLMKVHPEIFTLETQEGLTQFSRLFPILSEQMISPPSENLQQSRPLKVSELYMNIVMGALNEGLADYWGWFYSGQSHFVSESLVIDSKVRDLNVEAGMIPSSQKIKTTVGEYVDTLTGQSLPNESAIFAEWARPYYYEYGSTLARIFKSLATKGPRGQEITELDLKNQKLEVSRRILLTLRRWQEAVESQEDLGALTLSDFFTFFLETSPEARSVDCKVLLGKIPREIESIGVASSCREFTIDENNNSVIPQGDLLEQKQ